MSSFTDAPLELTPYVQQLPVEAMARVGMAREEQFQEGIKTVQSIYDSYLALPIAKAEVKNYVQQKVGQLNNAVKQSISGDFSDRRLTNQIGGLASQISKDPIVKNGVESTARMQAGIAKQKADQERAMKEGKNPVNNINDFNDKINSWLSDGSAESSFNSDYTPYVDVIERATKLFKDQNPGQTLDADAFRYDEKGNVVANEVYYKGIDPSRIQSVLNLVYSQPDVQQQLAIDGRQTFKGYDALAMSDYLMKTIQPNIDITDKAIKNLQIQMATDPSLNNEANNNQIKFLINQSKQLEARYNENIKNLTAGNLEAVKTGLVKEGITANFVNAYAFKTMEKSPLFDAKLEQAKYEQTLAAFEWTKEKDRFDMSMSEKNYGLAKTKAEAEAKAAGTSILTTSTIPLEKEQGKLGEATAKESLTVAQTNYTQSRRALAAQAAQDSPPVEGVPKIAPPYIQDPATGQWVWNNKEYKTEGEANGAAKQIFDSLANSYAGGNMSGKLRKLYEGSNTDYYVLKDRENTIKQVEDEFKPKMEEIRKKIGNPDYADAYTVDEDLPGAEDAAKRLTAKYGSDWKKGLGIGVEKGSGDAGTSARFKSSNIQVNRPNESAYRQAVKKMDEDNSITNTKTSFEKAYKDRQTARTVKSAELDITTPEKYNIIAGKVNSALSQYGKIKGAATSDAEAILEFIAQTDPKKKPNSIRAYYNTETKMGVIEVGKGDNMKSVNITKEYLFQVLPELEVDTEFEDRFGSRLALSRASGWGRSTDLTGQGRGADPYLISLPNYNVQYHIVESGDGQYNIQYYVSDKSNSQNAIINGDKYLETDASRSQIMAIINNQLSNSDFVQKLVDRKKLSK